MHDTLWQKFMPGDRIIYLGNYIGYGSDPCGTIDELLIFRRAVLSIPGVLAKDLVYLRGAQEEIWQKLLLLHFSPNPVELLLWMLSRGLSSTLASYGICHHEGIIAAQEGVMPLTRWTSSIREAIRSHPGHETFGTQLKRAAFISEESDAPILFVNSGINPELSLEEQGDNFWWSDNDFNKIIEPYGQFNKVIRGFDPKHRGMNINCVTATIDGGCGFGGPLVCAGFNNNSEIFEFLEA
jgi:serine/threonine protein phosphatase 1